MNISNFIKRHADAIVLSCGASLLIFALLPFTIAAFDPGGVLLKFMTDPGFWGNIIGASLTIWFIRVTIKEGRLSRKASLNQDIYTTETYRKGYIKALIEQAELTYSLLDLIKLEIGEEYKKELRRYSEGGLFSFVYSKDMTKQLQPEYADDCEIYFRRIESNFAKLGASDFDNEKCKEALEKLKDDHQCVLKDLNAALLKCQAIIDEHEAE